MDKHNKRVTERVQQWRQFSEEQEEWINSKKKYDRYNVFQYVTPPHLVESMLKYVFELKYSVDTGEPFDKPTIRSIAHLAQMLLEKLESDDDEQEL